MRLFLTAMVGMALIAGASPATAQDWEKVMQTRLKARVEQLQKEEGATLSPIGGAMWIGSLGEDESYVQEFDLTPRHVVVAVCDPDCEDIDLYLYDGDGEEVDADTEEGAKPVVFGPRGGGPHEIELYMVTCGAPPCYYAFGVFTRSSG